MDMTVQVRCKLYKYEYNDCKKIISFVDCDWQLCNYIRPCTTIAKNTHNSRHRIVKGNLLAATALLRFAL